MRTSSGFRTTLRSLALSASLLFANAAFANVDDGQGKEWRQLTETVGLSWTQIAQTCPQDGASPCSGLTGGRDLTGWTWATAPLGNPALRAQKKSRTRFKVEAEDLTPANYDVVVDGVGRGVLDVRMQPDGDVEAEIEFDTKRERGHVLLSFDPRGKLVTVERAGTCISRSCFPTND